jgi:23S rRNA pseudouridine1911/1915/1917 synthase
LFEDNHCLAVDKPAGLLTMGDSSGDPTLVDAARDYLRRKYNKPGNVFVGVVHRLDRPVSGVVLFARTSKGASRLSEQFRLRTVEKTYHALVEGNVSPPEGILRDRLVKDRARNVVAVVDEDDDDGQDCVLAYRRLRKSGRLTLVEIRPETGRSHQIRVQLSNHGWPIAGDQKFYWPARRLADVSASDVERDDYRECGSAEGVVTPGPWVRVVAAPVSASQSALDDSKTGRSASSC